MTRFYYAISHHYGANTGDENGNHIGTVYRFKSRAARDAWVDGGSEYRGQRDNRTALLWSKRTDRHSIKEAIKEADLYGRRWRSAGDTEGETLD